MLKNYIYEILFVLLFSFINFTFLCQIKNDKSHFTIYLIITFIYNAYILAHLIVNWKSTHLYSMYAGYQMSLSMFYILCISRVQVNFELFHDFYFRIVFIGIGLMVSFVLHLIFSYKHILHQEEKKLLIKRLVRV